MRSLLRLTARICRQSASSSLPRAEVSSTWPCPRNPAGVPQQSGSNNLISIERRSASLLEGSTGQEVAWRLKPGSLWRIATCQTGISQVAVAQHSCRESSQSLSRWTPHQGLFSAATPTWRNLAPAESANATATTPVRSPLLPKKLEKSADSGKKGKEALGRAILTGIKQSPKKVNLVAALIRGMRVDDALAQLAVSTKRAAKTIGQIVHAARANGVNNHGLAHAKLFVAEAFVGKETYLKRISIHGRGKSGVRERPRCMLTVVVKEMDSRQEGILQKMESFHWSRRKPGRLMPHRLITVGKEKPSGAANATQETTSATA